jgi:hypothetical protein
LSAPSEPDDGVFTAFSPDGGRIVTIFFDDKHWSLRLFERSTGALLAETATPATFGRVAFTPAGRRLVYIRTNEDFSDFNSKSSTRRRWSPSVHVCQSARPSRLTSW